MDHDLPKLVRSLSFSIPLRTTTPRMLDGNEYPPNPVGFLFVSLLGGMRYAFTTKSLFIGHLDHNYVKWQAESGYSGWWWSGLVGAKPRQSHPQTLECWIWFGKMSMFLLLRIQSVLYPPKTKMAMEHHYVLIGVTCSLFFIHGWFSMTSCWFSKGFSAVVLVLWLWLGMSQVASPKHAGPCSSPGKGIHRSPDWHNSTWKPTFFSGILMLPSLKLTACPWKMVVGRQVSFRGPSYFSGDMLVFGEVHPLEV